MYNLPLEVETMAAIQAANLKAGWYGISKYAEFHYSYSQAILRRKLPVEAIFRLRDRLPILFIRNIYESSNRKNLELLFEALLVYNSEFANSMKAFYMNYKKYEVLSFEYDLPVWPEVQFARLLPLY